MSRLGELYSGQLVIDRGDEKVVCDYDAYFNKLNNGMYEELTTGEIYSTISSDENFYIFNIIKVSKSTLFLIALKDTLFTRGYKPILENLDNFDEPELDSYDNLKENQKVYTKSHKTRVM